MEFVKLVRTAYSYRIFSLFSTTSWVKHKLIGDIWHKTGKDVVLSIQVGYIYRHEPMSLQAFL